MLVEFVCESGWCPSREVKAFWSLLEGISLTGSLWREPWKPGLLYLPVRLQQLDTRINRTWTTARAEEGPGSPGELGRGKEAPLERWASRGRFLNSISPGSS